MPDFHRVDISDDTFIRGAARFLWAALTVSFPSNISQVINLSNYNAMTNWNDLGATKTGVAITVNNTEEVFDVDQLYGEIDSQPTSWEASIATALAEVTLARFQVAWEGGTISTSGGESRMGFGQPRTYTRRMMAVVHQRTNNKLRAFVFRKAQRAAQESTITYAKTGDQQTIPVRFRALADSSIADEKDRLGVIFNQD